MILFDAIVQALKATYRLSRIEAESVAGYVIGDKLITSSLSSKEIGPACVAAALRRGREDHGWTAVRAAQEFGISRPTLSSYENAKTHPAVNLRESMWDRYDVRETNLRRGLNKIARKVR